MIRDRLSDPASWWRPRKLNLLKQYQLNATRCMRPKPESRATSAVGIEAALHRNPKLPCFSKPQAGRNWDWELCFRAGPLYEAGGDPPRPHKTQSESDVSQASAQLQSSTHKFGAM